MTITESALSRVSVAVRLIDDFTRRPPLLGPTAVFIPASGRTAMVNPGGYHVFTDLTAANVTIRIDNPYYFPKEVTIDMTALDSRNPVAVQTMTPNDRYPFPPASTRVRGLVRDSAGRPVGGAQVSVTGSTIGTQSAENGRFVLYWGPLSEDDISVVDQRRLVEVANSTAIGLHVTHPSFQPKDVSIGTVAEAELTLLANAIVLTP